MRYKKLKVKTTRDAVDSVYWSSQSERNVALQTRIEVVFYRTNLLVRCKIK